MVSVKNIEKKYKDFSLDCSLDVNPGKITGLIGQNGAGKSTSFKAILGLIHTDGGEIELFGNKVDELSVEDKEKLGVVLSDSGFSGYMTIKDIIPILAAMYKKFDKQMFIELCERFKLPLNKKLKDFSTGMSVKFKCIVAVTHEADLLILDEPTAGLDVVAREEMLDILREYMEKDDQRSILISSHISSDLEGLCDDIYMIDNGEIILHEDTDVLLDEYAILKLSDEEYREIDKEYILRMRKEKYETVCLTNQKQFYVENYPKITINKGNIDELIMMMIKGDKIS